jgi:hypothetical protein
VECTCLRLTASEALHQIALVEEEGLPFRNGRPFLWRETIRELEGAQRCLRRMRSPEVGIYTA